MPLQETPTLLSPYRWGQIVGAHPLHLSQVDMPSTNNSGLPTCGQPWFQYAYQDADRTGREDLAVAISTAEERIARELGFRPLPSWESDEVALHDAAFLREYFGGDRTARGMRRSVNAAWGMFCGGGQKAKSVIQAGAAVVYTDADSDGYKETATIGPLATTVTDANQIALFHPSTDSGSAGDDQWEIRPLKKVTISGGFVTIVLRRELLVEADFITVLEPAAVDGSDDANFLATVDVYRIYTDPSTQMRLEWEPLPASCGDTTSCAACSFTVQTGCVMPRDERNGILTFWPADWDADNQCWTEASWAACRAPDRVTLWYRAGYRDKRKTRPYLEMDPILERAIAFYAAALLDRPICGCENLRAFLEQWQIDLAMSHSDGNISRSFQYGGVDLISSPFGTSRGGFFAWNAIQRYRLGDGGMAMLA